MSTVSLFISGMFGFGVSVNFKPLLKSFIRFLDKVILEALFWWHPGCEIKNYHLSNHFLVCYLLLFGYPVFQEQLLRQNLHFY